MSSNAVKFILSLVLCQLAGIIGAFFTTSSLGAWYAHINKPAFTPPNWVFAPVWIFLYLVMGMALYLVWTAETTPKLKQTALILFFIQLVLNMSWCFFFFFLQSPLLGLIEIIVLWIFIGLTMIWFYKIKPSAALLLLPYWLWVSYAVALNFSIWKLNS
jgi:tryptophan-rich sensory protein